MQRRYLNIVIGILLMLCALKITSYLWSLSFSGTDTLESKEARLETEVIVEEDEEETATNLKGKLLCKFFMWIELLMML